MRGTLAFLPIVLLTPLFAWASENIIPAGSLIECTVSEHHFSSKTAQLGDPVLCQASLVEGAWGSALPYGTYLVGRFAEYKDPGHFVGKGWMELKFDRMILPPDRVVPLSAKVVYVPGLPVDKYGRIHGTGHAVRDIVEWSIPVLWPIDILALPRRGPRPVLKDETRLRLKVMDDMAVPGADMTRRTMLPMSSARPNPYGFATRPPAIMPSSYSQAAVAPLRESSALSRNGQLTVLMLNDGNGRLATNYWLEGNRQIRYIAANGASVVIPLDRLDLEATTEVNNRRGVPFIIRPAANY
jgi:hypothetical protein